MTDSNKKNSEEKPRLTMEERKLALEKNIQAKHLKAKERSKELEAKIQENKLKAKIPQLEGFKPDRLNAREVVVTDFDMPFMSLVGFIIKWNFAILLATLILVGPILLIIGVISIFL